MYWNTSIGLMLVWSVKCHEYLLNQSKDRILCKNSINLYPHVKRFLQQINIDGAYGDTRIA
jgi:hypothetical protein